MIFIYYLTEGTDKKLKKKMELERMGIIQSRRHRGGGGLRPPSHFLVAK